MSARFGVASLLAAALLGGAACLPQAEPPGQAPSERPATVRDAAPAATAVPAARPRPVVALLYSSGVHGRVSTREIPRPLPPGVTLTALAPRESTGGLARRATIVDRARLEAAGVVNVDAGDFLPLPADAPDLAAVGPKASERGADLVLAAYRRMGVDAVTLGERELATGAGELKRLVARAKAAHVRVVLANLADRKGASVFPADALVDASGLSVGILGVTELAADAVAPLAKAGYALGDAREAARAAAKSLRARGAKLVVALVHAAGPARAAAITEGLADIDVVVASQEADAPAPPAAATARPRVVSTGGESVGRVDVRFPKEGPPELDDRAVALGKNVRPQLGVDLLTRVATIPLIDTKKMEAAMVRGDKRIKMRDLYESWDYGSTKACGFCHEKQVAQWRTTDHAHAYATLKKAKHDHDTACLGCHVMGFLQPGGTRDIVMIEGGFADVGCEACHGPSAEHVRSVDKKKGTSRAVDPIVCLGCHTPDQNQGDFDPVAAMQEVLGPGHGPSSSSSSSLSPSSSTDAGAPDRSPARSP